MEENREHGEFLSDVTRVSFQTQSFADVPGAGFMKSLKLSQTQG